MRLNFFLYSKNSCTGKIIFSQNHLYIIYSSRNSYPLLLGRNVCCFTSNDGDYRKVRKYCSRKSFWDLVLSILQSSSAVQFPIQWSNSSTSEIMEYLGLGITKENCFSYFTFSEFYCFQFVRNSIFGAPIVEQKTISPTWSISCLILSAATRRERRKTWEQHTNVTKTKIGKKVL